MNVSPLAAAVLAVGMVGLGGCAEYGPLPLPDRPALASRLSELAAPADSPRRAPGVERIVRLALDNNPDLRAIRAQRAVARAQQFQAGLPPNPNLSGAVLPLIAGIGTTTAFSVGVAYDLKSLVTLSLRRSAAEQAAEQVDAQTLWQEWQVAGQVRLLVVDLIAGERSRRVLGQTQSLLEGRLAASQKSLAAGNTTLVATAPNVTALQAIRTQGITLARTQLQRRHQLNALLGLLPEAPVPLPAQATLPPIDPAGVLRSLPDLPNRRPDLVALQLGYGAQDSQLRAAILNQFPNLSFGGLGGSDNSNVRNIGPQITLELPIFDRNQGNIAIAEATREQLRAEYAARLATADGQVRAMLSEIALLQAQIAEARRGLRPVRAAAEQATVAETGGNLDERSYIDLVTARYARELEIIGLEQALLELQVAIGTLVGAGLPSVLVDRP